MVVGLPGNFDVTLGMPGLDVGLPGNFDVITLGMRGLDVTTGTEFTINLDVRRAPGGNGGWNDVIFLGQVPQRLVRKPVGKRT